VTVVRSWIKTRTPLTTWFEAAWHLTTAKNGLSAKNTGANAGHELSGSVGDAANGTVCRWYVANGNDCRETVEVDETLVGGVEQGGKRGRGTSKSIVVIAVEIKESKEFGRIRMRHVSDASSANLQPFICDVVAQGATVRTDGWTGYNGCQNMDIYTREQQCFPHRAIPPTSPCPVYTASSVFSSAGSWALIKAPSFRPTFSLTWRSSRSDSTDVPQTARGLVFRRLIERAVITGPVIEADVTFGYDWSQSQARRS